MIITNSNNYPITIEYRIECIDSPLEIEFQIETATHTVLITPEITIDVPCEDMELNQVLMTFVEKTANSALDRHYNKRECVFDLIDNEDKYINCFLINCLAYEGHISYKFICDYFETTEREIYSGTYQIPYTYRGNIMEYIKNYKIK